MTSPLEVTRDQQAMANEFFVDWDHPDYGPIKVLNNPIKLSKTKAEITMPAPKLGEHTEEILKGLGYDEGKIQAMKASGAMPAVIHTTIVPGEKLKITALSKGFGSENMSRLAMLTPAGGRQGVIDFVVKCVDEAGANPCPPVIVGVGIGGTAEKCMLLAKQSLLRRVGDPHPDSEIAELETAILSRVNDLGIGAMGYGGRITALAVHVEVFPTHIATLPVAVNLQCHSVRHREATL